MTLIDQIRDLIAEGETEKSLDELYNYVKANNADVIDNLVMMRSRMQNLRRAVQNGTMNDQDAAIERAKINDAILKLLPQLTPEYLAEASKRREPLQYAATPGNAPAAPARNMKMLYIIGGALLLVIALIIMFSRGGEDDTAVDNGVAPETEQGVDNQQQAPADYQQQNDGGQQEQGGYQEQQSNDQYPEQSEEGAPADSTE